MKKKGFTLVELLVVIAIIAMLLAILMPALNKVRQIAYRIVCGSNCSGLGKACLTYANDYQESYPVFGGGTTYYDPTHSIVGGGFANGWCQNTTSFTGTQGPLYTTSAPITASLYLLVKYSDVSTGSFVCKATSDKKFDLSLVDATTGWTTTPDVTQLWDFGPNPGQQKVTYNAQFCSYAFQQPYKTATNDTAYPITASSGAGMAVLADRNPWCTTTTTSDSTFFAKADTASPPTTGPIMLTDTYIGYSNGSVTGSQSKDMIRLANSKSHNQDGQNVLYADGHASFESTPMVGIQQDNIYTAWRNATQGGRTATNNGDDMMIGVQPTSHASNAQVMPQDATDSVLLN